MENNNMINNFKEYKKNQQELAGILKEASAVTSGLNMSKEKELSELSEKTQNDTFKIMVTGTFKNGKSTFINALLGEEILPAYSWPCTAVINEIKYGTEKKAILYFRNPLPDQIPEKLAEKAVRHMDKYKGRPIPPLEIPYDEIEDYVVIPMGADEKQMKLQSPYEKVELFYPLELLKNGVEIIDSPGLNEDETRTRVTMDYLGKVDAVLYVLNANAICAGDEMKFVESDLKGNQFDSVFFVVNRFDQIRSREQPQIRQYAEIKIKEYYPKPELFCISALNALDGRQDHDEALLERSGILPLEKRLTEFLTREKGKAKLVSPAKSVRQILSREALEIVIPKERELLDKSLDDVKKRYDNIRPRVEHAVREKELKKREMEAKIGGAGGKFERLARRQINDMTQSIPAWVEGFTPGTSLGLIPTRKKTEQAVTEISDYIKEKIEGAQNEWKQEVLSPEIEEVARSIFDAAEKDFSKIYDDIDSMNVELTGKEYNANAVPFWQRVAGVAGGLALGDIGLAVSGGVNGIGKEFAKTLVFELGAGFVLGLLNLLNPITLIGVIVAAFLFNFGKGSSRAMETLKSQVSEQAVNSMSGKAEQQARELADGIMDKLNKVKDQIVDSVSKELSDIEHQMKAIIKEKEKGETNVKMRKESLNESEKKIHALNTRLDKLIFSLVEV